MLLRFLPVELRSRAALIRLAAIAGVLLCVVASFAYVGGWITPARLTQARLMSGFDAVNGSHPGFRRNHAKGICVTGWFDGNGQLAGYSKAMIFSASRVPVIGRFALAGGMPLQGDTAAQVRSLALKLQAPGIAEWRTGMNDIPVFAVNSAQGFYDLLLDSKPDVRTGKPNPDVMKEFLLRHPDAARALPLIGARPISAGFADSTYNSLNAFLLVNQAGERVAVRWSVVPVQPFVSDAASTHGTADKNYLFEELIAAIGRHALAWHLVFTLAQPGDPTDDATVPWPPERRKIEAGVVTLDQVSSEESGACALVNYDPLVLPPGIEPSNDPLLSARSAAYANSFTLRVAEQARKAPSAIGPADVQRGGTR